MGERTLLQKTSRIFEVLSKLMIFIIILNGILAYLVKPVIVKIVHILFDNDFMYKIYTIIKDAFSVLPAKIHDAIFDFIPEPHTDKWGSNLEKVTEDMGTGFMIKIIIILMAVFFLYGITILLRHHYGEIAPLKNDREATKLKRKIIKSTSSRIWDKSRISGNRDANTWNVFKWWFNKKVREQRNKNKADRITKRTIRRCKVYITTTHEIKQPAPIKKYKVIFKNPDNTDAGNKLFSKIKDMHNKLIQFTKVTFDQYTQPKDRSVYIFEGSIEKEFKEARIISKNRESESLSSKTPEVQEKKENGNYPLELLIDKSSKIVGQKEAAQEYAEEKILDIDKYFASTDIQADLAHYNVGNSSIAYYYKPRYSKIGVSKNKIQEDLVKAIKMNEIMVSNDKDMVVINIGLDRKLWIDIDNRETISKAMAQAKDATQAVYGIALDNSIISYPVSEAPHMIVSGSTGSGKSVGVNYILSSISYNGKPSEIEFALLDPKKVEFTIYENHPCNIVKPITNPQDSVTFLKYAVYHMNDRYDEISKAKVRDIDAYNKKARKKNKPIMKKLIIVIDEYAELVMAEKEVEQYVTRLTQMGRASGIHLILATQRPSVDVLTGLIKNNMDTRIAYKLSSSIDSKVALDGYGAEKLNGKGDSLLRWQGQEPFVRMQGGFLVDEEVENIVEYLADNFESNPIVDYKARVNREEGQDVEEESNELFAAQTALNNARQGFEKENSAIETQSEEPFIEPKQEQKSKEDTKTVTVNPLDFLKDNDNPKNVIAPTDMSKHTEGKIQGQNKPINRRKTKEEMSDIDDLILNKAFQKVEERRKKRKAKG